MRKKQYAQTFPGRAYFRVCVHRFHNVRCHCRQLPVLHAMVNVNRCHGIKYPYSYSVKTVRPGCGCVQWCKRAAVCAVPPVLRVVRIIWHLCSAPFLVCFISPNIKQSVFPQICRDVFNFRHGINFPFVEIPGAGGYNNHSAPVVVRCIGVAVYAVQAAAILFSASGGVYVQVSVDLNIQDIVPRRSPFTTAGRGFQAPVPACYKAYRAYKAYCVPCGIRKPLILQGFPAFCRIASVTVFLGGRYCFFRGSCLFF